MSEIDIAGLEDFELVEAGGFGLVYRARQPRFERTVAVKVLQTRITDDKLQHQFRRECAAAGRVTGHPHIVTVFDAGFTPEGRPYIVMEWMDGGSLDDHLRAKGPLGPRAVVTIGAKVASALGAAHDQGVLHRDVKPANILISRYGEPELADFGIASLGPVTGLSVSAYALTPVHAAPEVLEGAKSSAASDIYSLASTLWTLLTGEAPFAGPADEAVVPMVMRILRSGLPALERPDVSPELVEVLTTAMAKSPGERPQRARDFGTSLLGTLDAAPAPRPQADRPTAPPPAPESGPGPADAERPEPQSEGTGGATEVVPGGQAAERPRGDVTEVLQRPEAAPEETAAEAPDPSPGRQRRLRLLTATVAAVLVLGAAGGAAVAFWPGSDTAAPPPQVTHQWPPNLGDCLADADPAADAYAPVVVSCDDPHVSEVVGRFLVSTQGTPYPGVDALSRGAVASPCGPDVYARYLGVAVATRPDLVATEIQPDEQSWLNGNAMFICIVEHADGSEMTARLSG